MRLISFPTCPFVQRAVLALEEKGADYTVEFIDLQDKPDWFLALSPRGKVPIVEVDGTVLFESQAICEYIDETIEPRLMPADPVGRALDRAWFAFASEELFGPMYRLMYTGEEDVLDKSRDHIRSRLAVIEGALQGDWLSGGGARFGMADLAFAPFFTRAALVREWADIDLFEGLPRVAAWAERLLARPAVARSVPADFVEVQREALEDAGARLMILGQ